MFAASPEVGGGNQIGGTQIRFGARVRRNAPKGIGAEPACGRVGVPNAEPASRDAVRQRLAHYAFRGLDSGRKSQRSGQGARLTHRLSEGPRSRSRTLRQGSLPGSFAQPSCCAARHGVGFGRNGLLARGMHLYSLGRALPCTAFRPPHLALRLRGIRTSLQAAPWAAPSRTRGRGKDAARSEDEC
jgi:hypothetical protein